MSKAIEITNSTGDPAFATDPSGRLVAWNAAIEKLLGYPAEEVLGRKCADVLNGTDVFGNHYCRDNCPLLVSDAPIRHCDLNAQTALDVKVRVRVHTLSVPHEGEQDRVVIHLLESLEEFQGDRESVPDREPPRRDPEAVASEHRLTSRQRQVLRMLALGLTTQEISEQLGISSKTTRNHIQNICERIGVHTRAGAVAFALRAGII